MSLLRMYLEPPEISGKENMKPNISVALNVLQEHRQKISIAKVRVTVVVENSMAGLQRVRHLRRTVSHASRSFLRLCRAY